MNINSTNLAQLTTHTSDDYEPVFSPDGQSVVFTSERDGNKEVYLSDIESRNIKNLTKDPGDDWNPRFYEDNMKIIFQSSRDGNWEIYSMDLNGRNQTNLTNHLRIILSLYFLKKILKDNYTYKCVDNNTVFLPKLVQLLQGGEIF